jgi:hypothetical protein
MGLQQGITSEHTQGSIFAKHSDLHVVPFLSSEIPKRQSDNLERQHLLINAQCAPLRRGIPIPSVHDQEVMACGDGKVGLIMLVQRSESQCRRFLRKRDLLGFMA